MNVKPAKQNASPAEHPSMFPNQIRRRAKALAIPEGIRDEFVTDVLKWAEHSGEEWTVSRLKAFTTYLTAKFANQEIALPDWIARTRSGRTKGTLGALEAYAMSSTKNFKKAQKLLRISTAFVATVVTPKQDSKFFESAMRPLSAVPAKYHLMMIKALREMRRQGLLHSKRLKRNEHILVSRRRPEHVEESLISDLTHFWSHETAQFGWLSRFYPILSQSLGDLVFTGRVRMNYGSNVLTVGKIKLSQEPGYKGRIYASPEVHLQHVLEPLKQGLGSILKVLPWDCTFDQKKGHPYIQKALQAGETVHCFDLSDATNNFPMELQETALHHLYTDEYSRMVVEFFSTVSKADWLVEIPNSEYDGKTIRFTRGQPLGLGPSFFSFDMCHGLLLFALNGYKWNGEFFVLGDDVIILCPKLARAYAQALSDLDLPWSKDKTLISSTVAEFAGYLFFADSSPLLKPKWKRLTKDNTLSSLELWGPGLLNEVAKEYREFVRWFVQQPFGFNWTLEPNKVSADELWDGFLDLFFTEEEQEPQEIEYSKYSLAYERFYKNNLGARNSVWSFTSVDINDEFLLDSIDNTENCAAFEAELLPDVLNAMFKAGLAPGDLHKRFIPGTRLRPTSPLLSRAKKERARRNKRIRLVKDEETNPVAALKAKIEAHDCERSTLLAETLRKKEKPSSHDA